MMLSLLTDSLIIMIPFRMAFFERQGELLTISQLSAEVLSHYKSQFIQQAYVLLLGLDVLGNPYGLVSDFTQGLGDFFYEPFLGTIQQPSKFSENLVMGVKSLLEHTVGQCMKGLIWAVGSQFVSLKGVWQGQPL